MLNILFLCTGNSCRSIMAEGILNHLGAARFQAFSAGSSPTGTVHPMSLETLRRHGMCAVGYESKSWNTVQNLVALDIVITVCDSAAGEVCPLFLGEPLKAHWGVPDPAHFIGTNEAIEAKFNGVFMLLKQRIEALIRLPVEQLNRDELVQSLREIGSK